jgi:undecaprenyl-diphosphatase
MKRHAKTVVHWGRRAADIWRRRGPRLMFVVAGAAILFCIGLFVTLADDVFGDDTIGFDRALLLWFRRADDPHIPIGPMWFREAALDTTALGSPFVLGLIALAALGFLYFEGQKRVALFAVGSLTGGALMSLLLKEYFQRPRPEVVPHLREVMSTSFPSGHAMGAAVVFLTLAVIFVKAFRSRRAKAFCLGLGIFLALIVGASRVYVGVHYPTDVAGGWLAGSAWALATWAVLQFLPTRPIPPADDSPGVSHAAAEREAALDVAE